MDCGFEGVELLGVLFDMFGELLLGVGDPLAHLHDHLGFGVVAGGRNQGQDRIGQAFFAALRQELLAVFECGNSHAPILAAHARAGGHSASRHWTRV